MLIDTGFIFRWWNIKKQEEKCKPLSFYQQSCIRGILQYLYILFNWQTCKGLPLGINIDKCTSGQQGLYIHRECTGPRKSGNATDGFYHMQNSFHAKGKQAYTKVIQIVLRGQIYFLKPDIKLCNKTRKKKKKRKNQTTNFSYTCDLDNHSGTAPSLLLLLGTGPNCVKIMCSLKGLFLTMWCMH